MATKTPTQVVGGLGAWFEVPAAKATPKAATPAKTTPAKTAAPVSDGVTFGIPEGAVNPANPTQDFAGNPIGLFSGDAQAANAAVVGPTPQQQASAKATISSTLNDYGLSSLTDWAWGLYLQGYDTTYIFNELRNQPAFKDRFAGMAVRQAAGLTPISPTQYVQREAAYDQATHAAGINGFFDRNALYTQWIGGDVSAAEVSQRAQNAYQAALGEPLDVRAELHRIYGDDAAGVATAYFLDPKNTLGEAQRRLQAGEIGAGSSRSGFGLLTRQEAEQLAGLGVTGTQAQQDFGKLAGESELFTPLIGQGNAETAITRQQQIDGMFGANAEAQKAIDRQAGGRVAQFSGPRGGQSKTGVAGLGEATI